MTLSDRERNCRLQSPLVPHDENLDKGRTECLGEEMYISLIVLLCQPVHEDPLAENEAKG